MDWTTARLAIGVFAIAAGCARESDDGVSGEVLEILAAHRSPDTYPEGEWIGTDEHGARMLQVRMERPGLWTLRSQLFLVSAASQQMNPSSSEVIRGDLSNGILTLESPLAGSMRLHVCRFAGEEILVPEESVMFASGNQEPSGTLYKRMKRKAFKRLEQFGECSRFPAVDPLPAGIWEGVDCPEWAWLKILPTGATGAFVVRRSQLLGGITTPANLRRSELGGRRAHARRAALRQFDVVRPSSGRGGLARASGGDPGGGRE